MNFTFGISTVADEQQNHMIWRDNMLHILDSIRTQKIPNYEKYIYDYETWLLFTSAMKCVNKFNLWEKYSKKYGGEKYDKAKNTKVWNSIKMKDYKLNPNIYFEHFRKYY